MKRIRPLLAMAFALALVCLGGGFAFADGGDGRSSVTDPSTMNDWQAIVGSDTSNIGRIWTDKTVSADKTITASSGTPIERGDSAFITALSALSSTSNAKSTSTTPLDIVLVLDASGSMDGSMGGGDNTKRIDALKSAANDFVSKIAKQNQGISDESKQHQVSIVKFAGNKSAAVGNDTYRDGGYLYNYSQVMKAMSPCTDRPHSRAPLTPSALPVPREPTTACSLHRAKPLTAKMPRRSLSSSPTAHPLPIAILKTA